MMPTEGLILDGGNEVSSARFSKECGPSAGVDTQAMTRSGYN